MSKTNANNLQQSIFDAVDTIVSRRIKEIDYDKTIIGIINSPAGIKNRKAIYKVEYAGGFFYASVLDDNDVYIKNTKVYVFVPQGDFSKDKIILGRADTINTSSNLNLVASAINNYSILGNNLIELTNSNETSAGIRSYHSKANESNEDPIKHRYNILYSNDKNSENNFVKIADKNALSTYAQEGTAFMVRADFRTDLPIEQRNIANARYGLSFKLKFKNENAGWGETQWDILNNISKRVSGKIEVPNFFENQTIILSDIIEIIDEIINNLDENTLNDFISLDGNLSQQINLIEELYRVFTTNNPENNLEIIEETVRAYVELLKELQNNSDISIIKREYDEWKVKLIETEEFKVLPCLLDSNKMLGSPLYFKKWTTQYAIFEADLTNFVGLEEIALFKENFNENSDKDTKEDIFVQNIQFYILEPLDTVSGDYNLKVESLTTGSVLSKEDDFASFTATLTRKIYEDLSANSNTSFYWFKEDPSVQIGEEGYHLYGGKGWYLLHSTKESKRTFRTSFDENQSKKNNYKCVAVYEENQDINIILECPFTVYNTAKGEIIELQSDLGTVFQFDVGIPTITCLISGQETDIKKSEITQETLANYFFYWSLITEDNQEILLYENNNGELDWANLSLDSFSTYQMQELYLKNIKFFNAAGEEISNSLKATRLQYPMVNINTGSKITIKCTVVSVDAQDETNKVTQGSAELIFENRRGAVVTGYRIVFEHDNQVFQYDEYGNSPAIKTKLDPQEILPIRAKLVGPNGLEISGTNIQVDWIFPIESTMIIPLENSLTLNPEDGLENLLKNSNNCTFMINDQYNPDAINNQITCRIKYKDINYYKDTNLFFRKIGENGTNGTDVTIRIFPISSATILNEQPLTLYTYPEEETIKGFFNDNAYFSNNGIEEIALTGDNGYLQTEVYQKGQLVNTGKYSLMWNLAGNPSESVNSKSNIFDIELDRENQTNIIKWSATTNQQINKKDYRLQNIKSHVTMTDSTGVSRDYYGYYPLPVIEYKSEKPAIYANRRIAIDKKTYLKEITYNADGRNPIYNHNQGLKIINLPIGSTIKWKAKGGWTEGENNPDFGLTFEKNDVIENTDSELESNLESQTEALIYIVPKDETTGSSTNNRIEAEISVNDNLYATIYAPIIITLNTFGLASLNAWDGNSVTIDEEGGYIMAPQIGAGEKDNNNRFTGIVMGKTETYTGGGDKEKQIGLFGYAHGLQSIFLDSETGNATFGLPDVYSELDENGNVIRKYQNTNRNSDDDYNEGRIELRPGDISKISGWRLGRRSLYYTTKLENDEWIYSGEIGPKYDDEDALHHEKDIKHEDQGILLSAVPAYLSIKGRPLTAAEISNSSDSQIQTGDSIELQLDPLNVALFAIYKHHNNKRELLSGINTKGQLVANRMEQTPISGGSTRTGLSIETILAFDNNIQNEQEIGFIGASFEAGKTGSSVGANALATEDFFDAFIEKDKAGQENAHVYITGGQFSNASGELNDYSKEFSIHGKSIGLFTTSNRSIEKTTDANIQISQDEGQINLGDNTQLYLSRKADQNNVLKTNGNFNWDIGIEGNRKNLNINSGNLIENIDGTTTITNSSNYVLDVKNSSSSHIYLRMRNSDNTNNQSYIAMTKDYINIGIPERDNVKSFISLNTETNKSSYWNLLNKDLEITLDNKAAGANAVKNESEPQQLKIGVNGISTGTLKNGTTSPQVRLYAGNLSDTNITDNKNNTAYTQILLNTSNNNWATPSSHSQTSPTGGYYNADGIPFMVQVKSASVTEEAQQTRSISIRTNVIHNTTNNTNTRYYNFFVEMGQRISGGLVVMGGISASDKNDASNYGIWSVKGVHTEQNASNISFGSTNFSGNGKSPSYSNGYYSVNSIQTLKDAIDNCLKAAGLAKSAADNAKSAADSAASSVTNLKNSLKSAAYRSASDFAAAEHSHSVSISPSTLTALYIPAGSVMRAGDNIVTGWTQTIHTLSANLD